MPVLLWIAAALARLAMTGKVPTRHAELVSASMNTRPPNWIAAALRGPRGDASLFVIASVSEAIQLACRYVTRHIDEWSRTHGSGGLTTSKRAVDADRNSVTLSLSLWSGSLWRMSRALGSKGLRSRLVSVC
jgi:hypothetical protein